jgi:hypothetical protein
MTVTKLYIMKNKDGSFAVRRPGSERASAICTTQAKAIERAHEIISDAEIYVERVKNIYIGGTDRWRKL